MQSRLKVLYDASIKQKMLEKFGYQSIYEIPKLDSIVLSVGCNKDANLKKIVGDLSLIACQKPITTKARKSIAQFGIRAGMEIGAKVTLRRNMMYHFIDRLIVAFLNFVEFQGLKEESINSVGKKTTLSFSILDKRIFHEIKEFSSVIEGFNINIVSNCKTKEELKYLLECFGLPFKRKYYGK